jgi:predicted transcriptional regulator
MLDEAESNVGVTVFFNEGVTEEAILEVQALIDARKSQNLTQKELSERTGITQADISRIENGTRNPSLNMIKRLADGMGMVL